MRTTTDAFEVLNNWDLYDAGRSPVSVIAESNMPLDTLTDLVRDLMGITKFDETFIVPVSLPAQMFMDYFAQYLSHAVVRDKINKRCEDIITVARRCFEAAYVMCNRRLTGDMRFLDAEARSKLEKMRQDDDRSSEEKRETKEYMDPDQVEQEKVDKALHPKKRGRPRKVGEYRPKTDKAIARMDRRSHLKSMKPKLWEIFKLGKDKDTTIEMFAKESGVQDGRSLAMLYTNFKMHGYKDD